MLTTRVFNRNRVGAVFKCFPHLLVVLSGILQLILRFLLDRRLAEGPYILVAFNEHVMTSEGLTGPILHHLGDTVARHLP
jgi:hypothetical protein